MRTQPQKPDDTIGDSISQPPMTGQPGYSLGQMGRRPFMKRSMLSFTRAALLLIGITPAAASLAFAAQTYLVTDLGSLNGGTSSAAGIDNHGQVAGTSTDAAGGFDAFLFSNGALHDLGNLGGSSSATALNTQGDVIGYSYLANATTTHPFLFRNGAMTDLGVPTGANFVSANGVNDSDQVVGTFVTGFKRSAVSHAFLWQNGTFQDIGTLGGSPANAVATAINDAGQIVGSSASPGGSHAFIWQNGVMTDLGTLPGGFSSSAAAITSHGLIAGSSGTANFGPSHAVLFQNGTVTDLGVPSGFTSSSANALNNNGVVVGVASTGSYKGINHAFIAQNGTITDLNRLIPGTASNWVLQSATGIDDSGIIVGTGTNSGVQRAFLLTLTTATTEPAAPINLTAISDDSLVGLSWTGSVGATSYNVKRSTSSSGPFTTIANVATTGFNDTSAVDCTIYTYVVSALNSAGESPNSSSTVGDPQSVPAAPSHLTATQNTQANLFDGSAIVLAWRNNATTCSESVIIERSADGVNFQDAFAVGSNQNTVVDGFLNSGTRYYYRVRAQSTGGESSPSNVASTVAP
jgi:probable HAF family extracellular repeat protein